MADIAKKLEHACGEVAACGIEDGIVVCKRNVLEPSGVEVFVKGRPATIVALEGKEPLQSSAVNRLSRLRIRRRTVPERHEDHHGVVGVGIVFVRMLEGPAARLDSWVAGGPVPRETHFAGLKPRRSFLKRWVVSGHTGFSKGDGGDGCVPDRGETGLDAKVVGIVNEEASEIGLGFFDQRVILRVAQSVECHEAVEHRWKNRRESIATLAHALGHPLLGPLQRILAEGMDGDAVVDFQERIAPQKKFRQAQKRLSFFKEKSAFSIPAG